MKLLDKRKIDSNKTEERRKEVEDGVSLAKSIDKLREAKVTEERKFLDFRDNALKTIKGEMAQLNLEKNLLMEDIKQKQELRNELLKPLDKEWAEINQAKAKQVQEKQNIFLLREQEKEERKLLDEEQAKIKKIATKIGQKHNETEKAKSEAISLKELAQREYEMAHSEHVVQTETYEEEMRKAQGLQDEYKVALSLIQIRENEVKEKESELLIREKHLESQQVALRIAKEALKL